MSSSKVLGLRTYMKSCFEKSIYVIHQSQCLFAWSFQWEFIFANAYLLRVSAKWWRLLNELDSLKRWNLLMVTIYPSIKTFCSWSTFVNMVEYHQFLWASPMLVWHLKGHWVWMVGLQPNLSFQKAAINGLSQRCRAGHLDCLQAERGLMMNPCTCGGVVGTIEYATGRLM